MQQFNVYNQINVATRKVKGNITARQLQTNFEESVRSLVCEDQAYLFMNSIRGTPAYWKAFLYDVLAMVKQLGLPAYFLTLSCADIKWEELVDIITKLNNLQNICNENIDYFKRCEILNQNPVLTARHFQYRVGKYFFTKDVHWAKLNIMLLKQSFNSEDHPIFIPFCASQILLIFPRKLKMII